MSRLHGEAIKQFQFGRHLRYVLTDMLFKETMSKQGEEANRLRSKLLFDLVDRNRSSFLIVKDHADAMSVSDSTSRPLCKQDLIHPEFTRQLRLLPFNQLTDLAIERWPASPELQFEEDREQRLIARANEFASLFSPKQQQELREGTISELAVSPELPVRFFGLQAEDHADAEVWNSRLRKWPTLDPTARFYRILSYYFARCCLGHPIHSNDLRDAEYLFSASYCDAILTSDKRLIEAAKVLFPTLQIATSCQDLADLSEIAA